MLVPWKCATVAMGAIIGMCLAVLVCTHVGSRVGVAAVFVETAIFALIDLSVGEGDERRRCCAWGCVVALVTAVQIHPVGAALGHILYFGLVDFVMPRDAVSRRRSAPSLFIGSWEWLYACSGLGNYYGYSEVSLAARGFYYLSLLVGFHYIGKAIEASTLTTSDYILCAGRTATSVLRLYFRVSQLSVHALIRSLLLVLLQRPLLKLVIPLAKGLYGDDGWYLGFAYHTVRNGVATGLYARRCLAAKHRFVSTNGVSRG